MKYSYDKARKTQDSEIQGLRKFSEVPTIINLKDCILSDSGIMYLVFDLLDTNLIDYYKMIKSEFNRNLDEREIKGIMYQICVALAALHQQGYSHRDIKPENVLLKINRGGIPSVKLVDFGLTKKLDPLFNTQYIATRWYRSPEVLLNMHYTENNDVFALGCLIVELYLGFEAFQGNDTIDQLNKIFAVLGTPNDSNWYEGARLIREKQIRFP
jgi:protein kinase